MSDEKLKTPCAARVFPYQVGENRLFHEKKVAERHNCVQNKRRVAD